VALVGGGVLGGEDGGAAGEAVGEGVHRRTLFAGGGAGSGGSIGCWWLVVGGWLLVRGWGGNRICRYWKASDVVVARADGDFARRVADVVGREGKIDEGVA
jgi:hypothetical protein